LVRKLSETNLEADLLEYESIFPFELSMIEGP